MAKMTLDADLISEHHNSSLNAILDAVKSGAGRNLAEAETLPPQAYVSEAFFAREVETVFRPGWVCVAHVSQLPQVGSYFTIDLFDERLLVVRGKDDVIRAMSRICLHRWAPVAEGCGTAKIFSCPFHKWAFDLDGVLLGAPLMEGVRFEADGKRLPQIRTATLDGFVYVNFDGGAPELEIALAGFSASLAKFRLEELQPMFELSYECKFNWKIMVETFMECYHHIAAHPETFERDFPARLASVDDGAASWTRGTSHLRPALADDHLKIGLPLLSEHLTAEEHRAFYMYLAYPSQLITIMPDRVYVFRSQPRGAALTSLQVAVLARPEAWELPNYQQLCAAEKAFADRINLEDIAVNTLQQLGAATRSATPGVLNHLEKAVWQLADYIREKTASGPSVD
jgi:phenylpropionate dioxygenase-like ring-hydroxylating dioxygenase large terminal subunit